VIAKITFRRNDGLKKKRVAKIQIEKQRVENHIEASPFFIVIMVMMLARNSRALGTSIGRVCNYDETANTVPAYWLCFIFAIGAFITAASSSLP
jgi:hypothetical protein